MEEKRIICGIYKITSPSGRVYIGQAVNIKKRWGAYRRLRCKRQIRLYESFLKYTPTVHTFEIVEECLEEDLDCIERKWQDHYDVTGRKGLNCVLQECGEKRRVLSDETLERYRQAQLGKKASDETRQLMREQRKGKNNRNGISLSEEHKEKLRQIGYTRKQKPESIEKTRAAHLKLVLNNETGVFYIGVEEAANSANLNVSTLRSKLNGYRKNDTPFIYV